MNQILKERLKHQRNSMSYTISDFISSLNRVEDQAAKADILENETFVLAVNLLNETISKFKEDYYSLKESDLPEINDFIVDHPYNDLLIMDSKSAPLMLYQVMSDEDADLMEAELKAHNDKMKEHNLPSISFGRSKIPLGYLCPDRIITVVPGKVKEWFDVNMLQKFVHKTVRSVVAPGLASFINSIEGLQREADSGEKTATEKFNEEFDRVKKEVQDARRGFVTGKRGRPIDPYRLPPDWYNPYDIFCSSSFTSNKPFSFNPPSVFFKS